MAYGLSFKNNDGIVVAEFDSSQVQIYKTLAAHIPGCLAYNTSATVVQDQGNQNHASYRGAMPVVLPQNIDREECFIFAAPDTLNSAWSRPFAVGVHWGKVTGFGVNVATSTDYSGTNVIDVSLGTWGGATSTPEPYANTAGLGSRPCSDNKGSGTQTDAPLPNHIDLRGATITSSSITFAGGSSATITNTTLSTYNNNPIVRLTLSRNISSTGSLLNGYFSLSDFDCFYLCDSALVGCIGEEFKLKIGILSLEEDTGEADDYGIRIESTSGNVVNFSTNREMFAGVAITNQRTNEALTMSNNNVLQTNITPPNRAYTVPADEDPENYYVCMNPCFAPTNAYADNGSIGSYTFGTNYDYIAGFSPMITFSPAGTAGNYHNITTIAFNSFIASSDLFKSNLFQFIMSPGCLNTKKSSGLLQSSTSRTWATARNLLVGTIL